MTRLFEDSKQDLESDTQNDTEGYAPSIVAVLDLTLNGRLTPTQLLVQLRNDVVKGFDRLFSFPDAHFSFIPFDLVAAVAWRRKREDPLYPAFYRSSTSRKIHAVVSIGKALLLGEAMEGVAELLGLTEFIEKGAQAAGGVLADKILERAIKTLEKSADGGVLAELMRKNDGTARDLEQFLPELLLHCINSAFGAKEDADGETRSSKRKAGQKIEFSLLVDAVDAFDAPSSLGDSVRCSIGSIVRRLIGVDFASVAFGGRTTSEQDSLPGWQESLGEGIKFKKIKLAPFMRYELVNCLEDDLGTDEEGINKLLGAIADECQDAPVHPSAYAESYRLVDTIPDAKIACAARKILWESGMHNFSRKDLLQKASSMFAAEECEDIVRVAWESSLWTQPSEDGQRRLNWHVIASAELFASFSERRSCGSEEVQNDERPHAK